MSAITTHVLDTSRGRPAAGLKVELHIQSGTEWEPLGAGVTDSNGRCGTLMGDEKLQSGAYRLLFDAGKAILRTSTPKLFTRKFQSFLKSPAPKRITTCRF